MGAAAERLIQQWVAAAEEYARDQLPAQSAEHLELMKMLQEIRDDVRKITGIEALPRERFKP